MFEKDNKLEKEYNVMASWEPRGEYINGILPLHFEYVFDTGEIMSAEEENGLAKIVLKKNNKIIFDFSELLAKNTEFITPSFFKRRNDLADKEGTSYDDLSWEGYEAELAEIEPASWEASPCGKYISIGDWRDPKELLTLLHEIGHTHQNPKEREEIREALKDINRASGGGFDKNFIKSFIEKERDLMKEESERERNAWAYALRQFRRVQNKTGVDLKSLFPAVNDLESFIEPKLRSHRRIFQFAVGHGYGQELEIQKEKQIFQEELLKYFDRPVRK